MRQLRHLLTFAARNLQHSPAASHLQAPQLWCGARAAAAHGSRSWGNARDSSLAPPLGIEGYATTDGPPHRGEREQSAEAASKDGAQLEAELATRDALVDGGSSGSGAAAEGAAAAAGERPPDAEVVEDATAAKDADVEAQLKALGFSEDEGGEDPEGFDAVSLSSSDDEAGEALLSSSDSDDEEEGGDELSALRKAAQREVAAQAAARQAGADGGTEGEGVLASIGRQMTVLEEIQQASKKRQRFLLQQQLSGRGDTQRLQEELRPPETGDFSVKIVDVNRTSKGARAGRVQGFSALVVVGNQNGILGQGSGKALEAKSAVDKATRKALKHLTYVPRFRGHTIHYPLTVLYGKTKLIMYPLSSARGIRASNLMTSLCQLAGIRDIGIKIQGSRNLRNSVAALFKAFDQMQTRVDEDSVDASEVVDLPHMPRMAPPVLDMSEFDDLVVDEAILRQEAATA